MLPQDRHASDRGEVEAFSVFVEHQRLDMEPFRFIAEDSQEGQPTSRVIYGIRDEEWQREKD
jgi:hypothetical protein